PAGPASALMPASARPGSGRGPAALPTRELALEALHPAARVDELLLARVERVADAADLHPDLRLGGPREELVAAGAAHRRGDVVRVDLGFHRTSLQDRGTRAMRASEKCSARPPTATGAPGGALRAALGATAPYVSRPRC